MERLSLGQPPLGSEPARSFTLLSVLGCSLPSPARGPRGRAYGAGASLRQPPLGSRAGQIVHTCKRVGVLLAQHPLAGLERARRSRLGLGQPALAPERKARLFSL